jgi:hypothetical protein
VWAVATLRRWCDLGCPQRDDFEHASDPPQGALTHRGGRALIAHTHRGSR